MSTQNILNIVQGIVTLPETHIDDQNIQASEYIDLGEAGSRLFGSANSSSLTAETIESAVAVTSTIIPVHSRFSGNIGSLEVSNMAASGTWKLSLVIGDGVYSRTESHCYGPEKSLDDAMNMAGQLAAKRAELLGRSSAANDFATGIGNASIKYARISDAYNPRIVQLLDWSDAVYAGYPVTPNTGGDHAGVAVMVRLRGQNLNDATVEQEKTWSSQFQPDTVCATGSYAGTAISVKTGLTFDQALKNYINFLTNPINRLGFVGNSISQVKKTCTNFTLQDNNLWKFTCTAHGYSTGDKVRITGSNNPKFNGTFRIIVIDANTVEISKGLNSDLAPATLARCQKIQNSNGSRSLDMYKYVPKLVQCRIRSRRPGRAFSPISFRKKARR